MRGDEKDRDQDDRPVEPASDHDRAGDEPPETAERPVRNIRHAKEPDAENIMPATDEPGTL